VASRLASPTILRSEGDTAFLDAIPDGEDGPRIEEAVLASLYGPPETVPVDADAMPPCSWDSNSRTLIRRPALLTGALAHRIEDHAHAVALSALHNNFLRVDKVSGVTAAMAAGIVDLPWNPRSIEAVLTMWENLKTGPWYERLVMLRRS
jgi:hypothetical protein